MSDNIKKLHLGCGKRDFGVGWTHIDCGLFPHVHSHNITQLSFDDESVDLVYASHVLEYFDREEVLLVLREWHRVLKSGGIIRLAVPDFEAMCKLYINNNFPLKSFLGPLYGKIQPMGLDKSIYHKTVYDFCSLEHVLYASGFSLVKTYDWRETEHSHIDDHSQAYLPHMHKEHGDLISLNIEAVKV